MNLKKRWIGIMICMLLLCGCQKVDTVSENKDIVAGTVATEKSAVSTVAVTAQDEQIEVAEPITLPVTAEMLTEENNLFHKDYPYEIVNDSNNYAIPTTLSALWVLDFKSPVTEITAIEGVLYFGDAAGNMYAVDAKSQAVIWHTLIQAPLEAKPVMTDSCLVFTSYEKIYGVAKDSGKVLWSFEPVVDKKFTAQLDDWDFFVAAPIYQDGLLYWWAANGKLYSINTETAQIEWMVDSGKKGASRSTPTIHESRIYVNNIMGNLLVVDLDSHAPVFNSKVGFTGFNEMLFDNQTLYASTRRSSILMAIDTETFKIKWQYVDKSGSWISGSPIIVNDLLYVPTSDSHSIVILRPDTGAITGKMKSKWNLFGKPIQDGDKLYMGEIQAYGNDDGNLLAFSMLEGHELLWSVHTGAVGNSITQAEGILYVPTLEGKIWAIDPAVQ